MLKDDKLATINCLLDDIKTMLADIPLIKNDLMLLEKRVTQLNLDIEDLSDSEDSHIKIPHRCPICNGTRLDEEGAICSLCDGSGLVWGLLG